MPDVDVPTVAARLLATLNTRWPDAAALAPTAPPAALDAVDGVTIVWTDRKARSLCPVDGTYRDTPPTITIFRSGSPERDNFTCLHELGHHIIALDPTWQFTEGPALGDQAAYREEDIVNTFASRLLIPEELLNEHVKHPATAQQILDLRNNSAASSTACLVRALDLPGHRLVMLTDLNGTPWFTATTGEPWAPAKNTPQPAVARAIDTAMRANGTHRQTSGEGIVYRTGKTNPWVEIDVAVYGSGAFVMVTPTRRDSRAFDTTGWDITCTSCGHEFSPEDSPGFCERCRGHNCPECTRCDCEPYEVVCERCFITLPVAEAAAGRSIHIDCDSQCTTGAHSNVGGL